MSKSRPHARRDARLRAFQVLYSLYFASGASASLGQVRAAFQDMPVSSDVDKDEAVTPDRSVSPRGFSWELVEGVWSHLADLDVIIERFSQNWRVDRLGRVELTLLRLAVFELMYRPDVPPKVAINEALELTSRFGDIKARRFINGILDAIIKALESGELKGVQRPDSSVVDSEQDSPVEQE